MMSMIINDKQASLHTPIMKFFTVHCFVSSLVLAVSRAETKYGQAGTLKEDASPNVGEEDFMAGWPEEDIIEFRQYYA